MTTVATKALISSPVKWAVGGWSCKSIICVYRHDHDTFFILITFLSLMFICDFSLHCRELYLIRKQNIYNIKSWRRCISWYIWYLLDNCHGQRGVWIFQESKECTTNALEYKSISPTSCQDWQLCMYEYWVRNDISNASKDTNTCPLCKQY